MRALLLATVAVCTFALGACATESSRTVEVAKVQSAAAPYSGVRVPISVGKFDNRSSYMRGVFSDGVDRLGSQAKTTLVAHLQQSQRFAVQDRDNMAETGTEAKISGAAQQLRPLALPTLHLVGQQRRTLGRRPDQLARRQRQREARAVDPASVQRHLHRLVAVAAPDDQRHHGAGQIRRQRSGECLRRRFAGQPGRHRLGPHHMQPGVGTEQGAGHLQVGAHGLAPAG